MRMVSISSSLVTRPAARLPRQTYEIALALGVYEHVVLHSGDFRMLFFKNNIFSLSTASLSLHNADSPGRQMAVQEMARVCAPGGLNIILDLAGYVAG